MNNFIQLNRIMNLLHINQKEEMSLSQFVRCCMALDKAIFRAWADFSFGSIRQSHCDITYLNKFNSKSNKSGNRHA